MAKAAVANMSAGILGTERFSLCSMGAGPGTERARGRLPASLTMRDPAAGLMLPVGVAGHPDGTHGTRDVNGSLS
jgi:hypothetical protein